MPTCPRCALAALALLFVLTGCSSNNPDDLASFRGRYAISQITFESSGVNTANVATRLVAAESEVNVTGSTAVFTFQYNGATECRQIGATSGAAIMTATAGRNTLSLSAQNGDARDALECLLLPSTFTLRTAETTTAPQTLTATIENARVNLHDYDRDSYNAGLDNVQGTLTVRLTRR